MKPSRCKNSICFHRFPHWPVMICGFLVACLTCSTVFIAVKIKYILLCIGAELLLIFYWSIRWPSLSFLISKRNFICFEMVSYCVALTDLELSCFNSRLVLNPLLRFQVCTTHPADSAFEQLLLVLLDSGKVIVNLPSLTYFAIATTGLVCMKISFVNISKCHW